MENKTQTHFNPLHPKHAEEYSQIKDLTGRQIIAYVKEKTGVAIDVPLKDKKKIIRMAISILKREKRVNNLSPAINISGWSKERFINYAYDNWRVNICSGWKLTTFFIPKSVVRNRFIEAANERHIRIEQ